MKILFIFIMTITAACSAPTDKNRFILKYENTADGLGSYHFTYETSDGSFREENGVLRNAEDPNKAYIAVNGRYSYIGPDGKSYIVTYTADEDGFQANGDHIPKTEDPSVRPLPPAIPKRPDGKFSKIKPSPPPPPSPRPKLPPATQRPAMPFLPPEVARSLLGVNPE